MGNKVLVSGQREAVADSLGYNTGGTHAPFNQHMVNPQSRTAGYSTHLCRSLLQAARGYDRWHRADQSGCLSTVRSPVASHHIDMESH